VSRVATETPLRRSPDDFVPETIDDDMLAEGGKW